MQIDLKKFYGQLKAQKVDYYARWSIVNMLVVGILLAAMIFTLSFVYAQVFSLFNNTQVIIVLNSELGIDPIDTDTYNKTREVIRLKETPIIVPASLRNIFFYGEVKTSKPEGTASGTIKKATQ